MRCEWKKMVMALALAAGAVGFAQTLERAQWQALVGESAQNPQTMKQTMAKLSDADQLAFVSEVNSAISKMPGSDESKAAAFYAANRAAVTGASKSNLAALRIWLMVSAFSLASCFGLSDWETKARIAATSTQTRVV